MKKKIEDESIYKATHFVGVKFKNNSQAYTYKSDRAYEAGDEVVVLSPYDGMTVVKVVNSREIAGEEGTYGFKWIVSSVERELYNLRVAHDAKHKMHYERMTKRNRLRKQLEELEAELNELGDD